MRKSIRRVIEFEFLFLCVLFSIGCFSSSPADNSNQTGSNESFALPSSDSAFNLAKPLLISDRPEDIAKAKTIRDLIENGDFANARWGVIAISLRDGRIAVSRDGQKLFNPASIEKILTSIVALDKLGKDFRWKTSIISQKQIDADGILRGDLILRGEGAPDFDSDEISRLIAQLKAKNLRRVNGKIIGDESFFKGDTIGDGWTWNELQWYYGAEASALSINENKVRIQLENGRPVTSPPTNYVELSGAVAPPNDEIESIGVKRGLEDNRIHVWGNGKDLDARVAVSNPALWAAKILRNELQKNGITVEGDATYTDWKSETNILNGGQEFASAQSATLGEIVHKMNKDSVNLYAELILRTLGKKFGSEAPDENPKLQKLRGDDSAGAAVVKKWLELHNIATEEISIHDGSGLSRLDFVSPEALARALVFASRAKFSEVFQNSLPVAGTDGTLKGRLQNLRGRVVAKTGSISYVNSLAGYLKSADQEAFAFVVIVNNETQKSDSSVLIDSIVSNIAN